MSIALATIEPPLGEPVGLPPAPVVAGKRAIFDVADAELAAWMAERGQPPMRVRQVRRWVLQARAESFEAMSDLPKALRAELEQHFTLFSTSVNRRLSAFDQTQKLLLSLHDGRVIECVLIQDSGRATACISTQVGCGMGCVFCASGVNGVARNLSSGEILEQLVRLRNLTARPDDGAKFGPNGPLATRLTHVVVMGMGEPLANLEALLQALSVAGDPNGLGIGARHITISTVGLPAKIRQLAESGKQYHLAVSLHAPSDELRSKIVPVNAKIGLDAILSAADDFYHRTGRQVTFEYVVLGGENDQPAHARQLAGLLRGRKAHVNLIPWNHVVGMPHQSPRPEDLAGLTETLKRSGVSVTVRQRRGAEIDAACGQLRREAEAKPL